MIIDMSIFLDIDLDEIPERLHSLWNLVWYQCRAGRRTDIAIELHVRCSGCGRSQVHGNEPEEGRVA